MQSTYRYRTFFWPALLILAGVIALLVNAGTISVDRVIQLVDLWPLILIVIGLEIIVRRSLRGMAGDVAALLIVVLAVVGAVGYVVVAPNPSTTHTLDASAPLGNLQQAALEIDVGAATISASSSTDIGSDLYRAHIEYAGTKPEVDFNDSTGKVTISQSNQNFVFQAHRFVLTLQLNPGVPWTFTENSGASTDKLNFANVHASSISLNTGASRDEIWLGTPSGSVPVEVNGGALTVLVHRPAGTAASVQVSGGAVTLNADGRTSHAIGNLSYETSDYAGVADRYQVTVNGGACTVTLDTATP